MTHISAPSSIQPQRLTVLTIIVWCVISVAEVTASYQNWKTIAPPAALANLSTIHVGTSYSINGALSATGAINRPSIETCILLANQRGGVPMLDGKNYSLTLHWISDDSSVDYAYSLYTQATQAYIGAPTGTPSLTKLDILFAPHSSTMTKPALDAVSQYNATIWTVGSSSNTIYAGYKYIWGNAALGDAWFTSSMDIFLSVPGGIKTVAWIVKSSDLFSVGVYNANKVRLAAAGVTEVFVAMTPATLNFGDASATTAFFTSAFMNSSFPQVVDLFILSSGNGDLPAVAAALKVSGKAPKIAAFTQFYNEDAATLAIGEGWVSTWTYRADVSHTATLPGVLYKDGPDFVQKFMQVNPGVTPNPTHAQDSASCEGMLAALYTTKSLSSDDLREANLALNGSTFFTYLKYSPTTGANPYQTLTSYQIQNGQSVRIRTAADLLYPTPWSWTIPVVYSQTHSQLSLMAVSLAAIGLLLGLGIAFFIHRDHRVFHAASPIMLAFVLVGNISVLVAAVFSVLPPNEYVCSGSSWLFNIGFTMALGSLFLKTFRLHSIFHSNQLSVTVLKDRVLIIALFGFILWDSLLLSIRTGVSPYSHLPDIQMCQVSASVTSSASTVADTMNGLLIASKGLLLLGGAILCFKVRHLPSLYNESSFLAICIYNNAVLSLIWLVVRYVFNFNSNPISLSLLESAVMIAGSLVTISFIFLPKFVTIFQTRAHHRHRHTTKGKSALDTKMTNLNASHLGSGRLSATSQPSSPTAGTTMAMVLDGMTGLLEQLEVKLQKCFTDFGMIQMKLAVKKTEITETRQTIAMVQAEQEYLKDKGNQMTPAELRQMLRQRIRGTGAVGQGAVSGSATSHSNEGTSGPSSPANGQLANASLTPLAELYKRILNGGGAIDPAPPVGGGSQSGGLNTMNNSQLPSARPSTVRGHISVPTAQPSPSPAASGSQSTTTAHSHGTGSLKQPFPVAVSPRLPRLSVSGPAGSAVTLPTMPSPPVLAVDVTTTTNPAPASAASVANPTPTSILSPVSGRSIRLHLSPGVTDSTLIGLSSHSNSASDTSIVNQP